jgi:hypothetical protein
MKFVVNRKLFLEKLKKFLSKGKMTIRSSNEYNIERVKFYTFDGKLNMIGASGSDILCGKTTVPVEIIEEGEVIDPEYAVIIDTLKDMDGEKVTMEFSGNTMFIDDGNEKQEFGIQKLLDFPDKVVDFDSMNFVEGEHVWFQQSEAVKHNYNRWFSITDLKQAVSFTSKLLDKVGNDLITFDTTEDNLIIETKNADNARSSKKSFGAKVYDKKRLNTNFIPGVMPSIEGLNTFYWYITQTGKTKIFIINEDTHWLITINTPIQE